MPFEKRAYVVSERSAVSSVVSIVMLDVLKLMENFSWKSNTYMNISDKSVSEKAK